MTSSGMNRKPERSRASSRAGFTFLEVFIAMLIVVVLSGVAGLSYYTHLKKARRDATILQVRTFRQALQMYRASHSALPTQAQGLEALVAVPTRPPVPENYPEEAYLETRNLPRDGWGNEFVYSVPASDGSAYEIVSYGSDGEPGGSGDAADISNLDL